MCRCSLWAIHKCYQHFTNTPPTLMPPPSVNIGSTSPQPSSAIASLVPSSAHQSSFQFVVRSFIRVCVFEKKQFVRMWECVENNVTYQVANLLWYRKDSLFVVGAPVNRDPFPITALWSQTAVNLRLMPQFLKICAKVKSMRPCEPKVP